MSLEEYASYFDNIDPVAQYKSWAVNQALRKTANSTMPIQGFDVASGRVKAAFVVSDPVDWGRDIQNPAPTCSSNAASLQRYGILYVCGAAYFTDSIPSNPSWSDISDMLKENNGETNLDELHSQLRCTIYGKQGIKFSFKECS